MQYVDISYDTIIRYNTVRYIYNDIHIAVVTNIVLQYIYTHTLSCTHVIFATNSEFFLIENAFDSSDFVAAAFLCQSFGVSCHLVVPKPVKQLWNSKKFKGLKNLKSPKVSKVSQKYQTPNLLKIATPLVFSFFNRLFHGSPTQLGLRPLDPRDLQLAIWGMLQSLDSGDASGDRQHTGAAFETGRISSSKNRWKEMSFLVFMCLMFRLDEIKWLPNDDP